MQSLFQFASLPQMAFGEKSLFKLPSIVEVYGKRCLLLTGKTSFPQSPAAEALDLLWKQYGIELLTERISSEPSPDMIDQIVAKHKANQPDVLVSIGGGSVLDAGKAISAMFCEQGSIRQYLEGIGDRQPVGEKIPFIAVPTTAGTGSEVTKNAVISEVGPTGFKRSLRHDNYIPDVVIMDPGLTISLPPDQTAASGMDAFTQLLESYLSTKANPFTDSIALQGLRMIKENLPRVIGDGKNIEARTGMLHTSMLSGICLANVGLGLVHGFASSIGGKFHIPHGALCGTLMGPVNKITLKKIRAKDDASLMIKKYAEVGKIFIDEVSIIHSDSYYAQYLVEMIDSWAEAFTLPWLNDFGISKADIPLITKTTSHKNHPIILEEEDLTEILSSRIGELTST